MPPRSKIARLPPDIKTEFDKKLVNNGFSSYRELSAWLLDQGYEISKTTVGNYSKEFKERLAFIREATEQAKAIAQEAGDDDNSLGDALTRMVQHQIFQILVELQLDEKMSLDDIERLSRSVSHLNRVAIAQKRFMDEVRRKINEVADEIETRLQSKVGMTDEFAASLRAKLLKINP